MGELLSCYWCTGVWSSIALCTFYLIFPTIATPVLLILAVSGADLLLLKPLSNYGCEATKLLTIGN